MKTQSDLDTMTDQLLNDESLRTVHGGLTGGYLFAGERGKRLRELLDRLRKNGPLTPPPVR